jgi:hypothetical protein
LSTAHGLLTDAERVQADQVAGPAVADTRAAAPALVRVRSGSLRLAGLLATPAADRRAQVLGEVLQRGQRGHQGGRLPWG